MFDAFEQLNNIDDTYINLDEEQGRKQGNENRKLKRKFLGDHATNFCVHHLSDNRLADDPDLKSSDLNNILFLRKTHTGDSNALHQFITAAANIGSVEKLLQFVTSENVILKPVIENGSLTVVPITLDEAVQATINKRNSI